MYGNIFSPACFEYRAFITLEVFSKLDLENNTFSFIQASRVTRLILKHIILFVVVSFSA